jgi:PAS domain S-box-containing protein
MEISGLINLTIIMQGVQTLLVSLVFFQFYYTYRRHYLQLWAWSWLCFSAYFFGGLASFALITHFSPSHPLRLLTSSLYLSAGYLQVPLLLLGAYELASGKIASTRTLVRLLVSAAAFAIALVVLTTFITDPSVRFFLRIGLHSLVSGGAFLLGVYLIFRGWSLSRKPGSMIALSGFFLYGVYQFFYATLSLPSFNSAGSSNLLFYYILTETILLFWTSLGLVVWLLEDERRQATEAKDALEVSEERFKAQYKGVPIPTYTWRRVDDDFILVDYNDAADKVTKGKGREFIGSKATEVYSDEPELIENFSRCYKDRGVVSSSGQFRYKTTGELRSLEVSFVFVLPDIVMVHTRDVTEQSEAERGLHESEKQYRFMAEAMPQQVWTAGADGLLDYVNERCIDYFGYTENRGLDMEWQDVVHPDDLSTCAQKWGSSLQTGETYEVEFQLKGDDGKYRWHLGRASAMRDEDGNIVKWVGTNTNIDKLKKAEETLLEMKSQLLQSQKLESVGRLAGGIAHDFNNMLTAINGYSDLILRKLDQNSPLRANLEEIKKAGNRSAELTHQLLAFSRQQVLQPKVLIVNEVVSDTSKMLQRLIGEHIRLNLSLCPDLNLIEADPGQLVQVIMNLAVNARDALPDGGILSMETANVYLDEGYGDRHVSAEPGSYVMLTVRDNGLGIDKEVLPHIFDPFFTTKEIGKGTGLGLATAYGIVKQSGGYIWVDSEVDCGTTFKIYLPCVESTLETNETIDSEKAFPLGTETVLLVEDEDMVRELVREVLESCGYRVITACNGAEALELFTQPGFEIDLLMTDVVMPEMDGRQLAEIISKSHSQIPVLFASGYTNDSRIVNGIAEAGANFIQKPFAAHALARKISDILHSPNK